MLSGFVTIARMMKLTHAKVRYTLWGVLDYAHGYRLGTELLYHKPRYGGTVCTWVHKFPDQKTSRRPPYFQIQFLPIHSPILLENARKARAGKF